jgi:hypothetical protein
MQGVTAVFALVVWCTYHASCMLWCSVVYVYVCVSCRYWLLLCISVGCCIDAVVVVVAVLHE